MTITSFSELNYENNFLIYYLLISYDTQGN